MSTTGLMVTVVGWAASTPREVVGDGVPYTSFRVATTPRYFDSRQGVWADGRTEWFTAKAFRDVAFNVAASIRKGDPVLVHGRMRTEEWVGENGPRSGLVLDVTAVGHDLTRGRSSFARRTHVSGGQGDEQAGATAHEPGPDQVVEGSAQTPVDASAHDPWATEGAVSSESLDEELVAATP
ncbi:single-stranded DNA-binding protein [Actinotalea sp. K2]|uniref:single-stranded DNA-binding protein n=1 Tax=Actinotalea sp. K2 TaxID=2939438 RepID=UPI0020170FBC|nr:single-stranded DNA-binding protein [Actinotalea sp. K2]MCL3860349.1 single-stranded DNA-binding protein [Actinotalea sp. K2]